MAAVLVYVVVFSSFFAYSSSQNTLHVDVNVLSTNVSGQKRMKFQLTNRMDRPIDPLFGYVQSSPTTYYLERLEGSKTLEPGESDIYVVGFDPKYSIPRWDRELSLVVQDSGTQYRYKKRIDPGENVPIANPFFDTRGQLWGWHVTKQNPDSMEFNISNGGEGAVAELRPVKPGQTCGVKINQRTDYLKTVSVSMNAVRPGGSMGLRVNSRSVHLDYRLGNSSGSRFQVLYGTPEEKSPTKSLRYVENVSSGDFNVNISELAERAGVSYRMPEEISLGFYLEKDNCSGDPVALRLEEIRGRK